MKFDCGGAAAILGTARAIAQLEPKGVEVHFVIAACDVRGTKIGLFLLEIKAINHSVAET